MYTENIAIPPSLQVLTTSELEGVILTSIKASVDVKELVPVLEQRYKTRRSANKIASTIVQSELNRLHDKLSSVESIDLNEQFTLSVLPARQYFTVSQNK